jgi:membrane fusion protein (multidrug efflux system)
MIKQGERKEKFNAALPVPRFFGLFCHRSASALSGRRPKGRPPRPQAAAVLYMVAVPERLPIRFELPGRISPFTVSEVRPQVSGIIKERLFEEGANVVSGQVLYVIDPELYRAAFNEAEAALHKAEANAEAVNLRARRYGTLTNFPGFFRQM